MKMKEERRLPLGFGPVLVPEVTSWEEVFSIGVSFETDEEILKGMLPKGVMLNSPTVKVTQHCYKGASFLAGRAYNLILISIDAKKDDDVLSRYIPVRWLNDVVAILDQRYGRFNFPDLYADIDNPIVLEGKYTCYASEYQHKILKFTAEGFRKATEQELAEFQNNVKNTKLILDESEVNAKITVNSLEYGKGTVKFLPAKWEDTPNSEYVVNFLTKLPIKKYINAIKWTGSMQFESK
jgi:hypothetical protein